VRAAPPSCQRRAARHCACVVVPRRARSRLTPSGGRKDTTRRR
jgi:hypothetical protein